MAYVVVTETQEQKNQGYTTKHTRSAKKGQQSSRNKSEIRNQGMKMEWEAEEMPEWKGKKRKEDEDRSGGKGDRPPRMTR